MAMRLYKICAVGLLACSCALLCLYCYSGRPPIAVQDGKEPWCRIPVFDPMGKSTKKIFGGRVPAPVRCRADALSLSHVRDRVLYVDREKLARVARTLYPHLPDTALRCCVSDLFRGPAEGTGTDPWKDDREFTLGPCRPFFHRVWISSEFVVVRCRAKGEELYSGVHSSVSAGASAWLKRRGEGGRGEGLERKRPSVLLLGIDSTSRLNSLRFLTQTRARLADVGAVEMTMYNKVGENTLPNLLPVLAGISVPHAKSSRPKIVPPPDGLGCWPSRNHTFDRCPFLWKRLSSLGYATMFAEDEPDISTFNYHRPGFGQQPTDFYIRPLFLASSRFLPITTRDGMSVCFGPRPTTEILLEYASDFVRWASGRMIPFFGVIWTSNLSHQDAAGVSLADRIVAEFVREAAGMRVKDGLLLVVLSDHGMRWGPLRESPSGWLEERMPFLFVRPPGGADIPHLTINSRRLVSPFDLHATLSAFLFPDRSPPHTSCPGCVDLLSETLSVERTCEGAAIPEEWCTCGGETGTLLAGGVAPQLASLALDAVNGETEPHRAACALLSLSHVAGVRSASDSVLVRFVVTPGGGVFEGRLRRGEGGQWRVLGAVSRINAYGDSSVCIDDPTAKLYCHCA